MYTIIKIHSQDAIGGIYCVNSTLHRPKVLFLKNASLACDINGKSYAFFVIERQNGDILRSFSTGEYLRFPPCEDTHSLLFCYNVSIITEMLKFLPEQKKPLPGWVGNLLCDNLPILLSPVPNFRDQEIIRYWDCYEKVLKHFGKNASAFTGQALIDKFFLSLAKRWDLRLFDIVSKSLFITVTSEVHSAYKKARRDVKKTITMAKKLIKTKNYKDLNSKYLGDPSDLFDLPDTPCGNVQISIVMGTMLKVFIQLDTHPQTVIDISVECQNFQKKFKEKI